MNTIINVEITKDLCNEDASLEQDHVEEPMSSDCFLDTSISSNTYSSPKTSHLSNIIPLKKGPNYFHAVPYSYPQGLPLKETQANLHLAKNPFHASKTKHPQTSCDTMSAMPTSASPSLPLQDPIMQTSYTFLSLEVAPCQEDPKKDIK